MDGLTYRYFKGERLYPFGYGLSYTTFEYDTPQLSTKEIASGGAIKVTVEVKNTGSMAGEEVVQLYFVINRFDIVKFNSSKFLPFLVLYSCDFLI